MKSELEVLREVRDLLKENWNAIYYARGGRHCLVGGINKVTKVSSNLDSTLTKNPLFPWLRKKYRVRVNVISLLEECNGGEWLERYNDNKGKARVLELLDRTIAGLEPKAMDVGQPEKEYTIEPAEPVPGVKERPSEPLPTPEPVTPEREKVPA